MQIYLKIKNKQKKKNPMITDKNSNFNIFKYMQPFWDPSQYFVLSACKNETYAFYSYSD